MTNRLLLHSLSVFNELIFKCFDLCDVHRAVEIGMGEGEFTRELIRWSEKTASELHCVDPEPPEEILKLIAASKGVHIYPGTSLDRLCELPPADAYLLDGDHNYFTLRFELESSMRISYEGGRQPLLFVHDITSPWARRDLYFAPESLPKEALHPHIPANDMILAGDVEFGRKGHLRLSGSMSAAKVEGGPANGVLTAVEDFLREHADFLSVQIPCVFGLAVIYPRKAIYVNQLSHFLQPYHNNPLMRRLEENRMALYKAYFKWRLKGPIKT